MFAKKKKKKLLLFGDFLFWTEEKGTVDGNPLELLIEILLWIILCNRKLLSYQSSGKC